MASLTATAVAGCSLGGHHHMSTGSRTTTGSRSSSASATVRAFASAYVRFLQGRLSAAALPDASVTARRIAGQAGRVPQRALPAGLRLTGTVHNGRFGGSWLLSMRDGAHELNASLIILRSGTGWRVMNLIPPDFSTQLAPAASTARHSLPAGAAAPAAAARVFLSGYLPFEYGHEPLREIRDLTPRLRGFLVRNTPRLDAPLHPRIVAFAIHRDGASWVATPSVSDGADTYEVDVTMVRRGHRWLANAATTPDADSARSTPTGSQPSSSQLTSLRQRPGAGAAGAVEALARGEVVAISE